MQRPVLFHCLFFILGIYIAYSMQKFAILFLLFILFFGLTFVLHRNSRGLTPLLYWGSFLFFSIGLFLFHMLNQNLDAQYAEFHGKEVTIEGDLISDGEERNKSRRYILEGKQIQMEGVTLKGQGKLLLYIKGDKASQIFHFGQKIRLKGLLEKPRPQRNPGGFDYALYLKTLGVSGILYADANAVSLLADEGGNWLIKSGLNVQKVLVSKIEHHFPPEQAGLLNGILIGYRDGLTEPMQEAFSKAGLTHIMAVSGANILFIILPCAFLLKKFGIFKKHANGILILILAFFVMITGFQPSVLRAVLMADVILLGQMLRRESDFFSSLSFSAMLLLLFNPFTLFDAGFLLSYGATLSLVMFYKPIQEKLNFPWMPTVAKDILAATLAAQIGVLPVTLSYFNTVGVIAFVTNLFVLPLTGLLTIGGFVFLAILALHAGVASLLAGILNLMLSFILWITKLSSDFDYAVFYLPTPGLFVVMLYMGLMLLLYLKPLFAQQQKKKILLGLLLYLIVLMVKSTFFSKLEIVYLDVGQGDATFVQTPSGKTLLIDGGGYTGGGASDQGEQTVLPFLYHRGVRSLDWMISTHADADHVAGLFSVAEKLPVKTVLKPGNTEKYQKFNALLEEKKIRSIQVGEEDVLQLEKDIRLSFLNPPKISGEAPQGERQTEITAESGESLTNIQSLAFVLDYDQTAFLFCGDIPIGVEQRLLQAAKVPQADVMMIPHHGAKSSASLEFLERVNPRLAFISTGKNIYGHPAKETLGRLTQLGIPYFRSDVSGALLLRSDGKSITYSTLIQVKAKE